MTIRRKVITLSAYPGEVDAGSPIRICVNV